MDCEMSVVSFRDFCKGFREILVSFHQEDQEIDRDIPIEVLNMQYTNIYIDIVYNRIVLSNEYGYMQYNHVRKIKLRRNTYGNYEFSICCDRNGTQKEITFIAKLM